MILKTYFISIFSMAAVLAAAQDLTLTNQAIGLYETDLAGAKAIIDKAIETDEALHPYTWYTRAFVYKEIFKKTDNGDKHSLNRDIAVESIERCIKLDPLGKYSEGCGHVLEYISNTYWLNADDEIGILTEQNIREPEKFYAEYKRTYLINHTADEIRDEEISFYKSLAQAHANIYLQDVYKNEQYIYSAISHYEKALAHDSLDYESNYNVATAYYNMGIYMLRKLGPHTSMDDLLITQDNCIMLFSKALPYMLRAHDQRPDRQETLKGLYIIYRALSDEDNLELFRSLLLKVAPMQMDNPKPPQNPEKERKE